MNLSNLLGCTRVISSAKRLSLVGVVAVSLSACSEQSAGEYIQSAQSYLANNDIPAAVIELKNALKKEPKNAQARRLLGESYLALNMGAAAEKELSRALDLGSETVDIYPSLVRAYFLQQKYQELIDTAAPTGLPQSDEILVTVLRGVSHLYLQQKEQASIEFQTATTLDESAHYSQLGQAYLATSEDKIDNAITLLDKLLVDEPNFNEALILKARLMMSRKAFEQAAQIYKKLVEINPKDLSYALRLANVQMKLKRFDEAKQTLAEVMKRYPKHPNSNLMLAELEYQLKDYQAAKDAASVVLSALPSNVKAKMLMGLSSYQLNDYEQAHRYLTAVESVTPPQHPLRRTLAIVQYKMGYLDQAAETIAPLDKMGPEDARLLEAIGLRQVGKSDYKSALTSLQQAAELDPDNYKLKARLGVLKLADEDTSGLLDLNEAISGDPELGKVKLYEALYYVNQKQFDKAMAMAKQWQREDADRIDGYNLEGLIYNRQGKTEQAVVMFNKVLANDPENRTARGHLAAIAIAAKDYPEAKAQYLALLKAYPEDEGAHVRLSALALNENNQDEAKGYFKATLEQYPDSDRIRLRYAQLLARLGEQEEAVKQLDKLGAEVGSGIDAQVMKADLLLSQNKLADARAVYEKVVQARPDNLTARLKMLATYRLASDSEGLMAALAASIKERPDSVELKRLEIAELVEANKLELAFKRIDALRADSQLLALADELDASAYLKEQKRKAAIVSLEKSVRRQANEARIARLATLYTQEQQSDKAIALLEQWIAEHPNAVHSKLALSLHYNSAAPKKAEKLYREILERDPDNVTVLNNLSWMLTENGRHEEAVYLGRRAAELAPENGAVLDTYGYALIAKPDAKNAIMVLEKAVALAPKDNSIRYHLAQAYHLDKRNKDAKQALEQALASGIPFADEAQAKALLKRL